MSVIGHGVEIVDSVLTRPASPAKGMLIYQQDTNQLLLWDGAAWVTPMANQPAGGVLGGTYPDPSLGAVTTINSGASALNLQTGGTNRLTIDTSGRVQMPYQPMFSAGRTGGGVVTGEWTGYNQIATNVGNHFNGSNGRFTAPVTGKYYFSAAGFGEYTYNPVAISLRINGSHPYGGAWRGYQEINGQTYGAPSGLSAIWPLNAGQYVSVFTDVGGIHGNASMQFTGFLLA